MVFINLIWALGKLSWSPGDVKGLQSHIVGRDKVFFSKIRGSLFFFSKFWMIVSRFPFSCRFPLAAGCKICKICHMLSFTFHICVMNFYSHGLVQLRELHPINVSKKIVISFAKEQSHLTWVISQWNIVHGKNQNCPFVYLTYTFVSEKNILFANIQMKWRHWSLSLVLNIPS